MKTKIKRRMAIEIRTTVCEIFLGRPTQEASKPKGSFVFMFTCQKDEIAKYVREPKLQGLLAENALAKQYLGQNSYVT